MTPWPWSFGWRHRLAPAVGLTSTIALTGVTAGVSEGAPSSRVAETPALRLPVTATGEDWTLRADVEPTPGTGFFTMGTASRRPEVEHRGHTVTWAELNPGDGLFDWAPITDRLQRADAEGYGVVFRVKANVTARQSPWGPLQAVPQWVLDKHRPPVVFTRNRGPADYIKVAVPWHPGLQAEHLAFIRAFTGQPFSRHPKLLGVYVHGISTSFGEEFWMDRAAFHNLAAAGMTPDLLSRAFADRLDAWASGMKDRVHLLAWVGSGWIDATRSQKTAYRQLRHDLDAVALELGMGRRTGNIESYHGYPEQVGQAVDQNGYLLTDGGHPLVAEERYWGSENENWPGSVDEAYEYRTALLRALQMRLRLLWVSDRAVALDPEVSRYFLLTAGKNAAEAPDALSLLREAEIRWGGRPIRLKNFERWLHQRDADGSRTRRARPVRRRPQWSDSGPPQDWTARSTDRASGQDRITFRVDHAFLSPAASQEMILKVTWLDDGATWYLRHGSSTGVLDSPSISGSGDGEIKTTTLRLVDFVPSRALRGGFDLALVAMRGDLTVTVVRLLRPGSAAGQPDDRAST